MSKPIALVTGGGIGIGSAISSKFLDNGYRVIVTDILKPEGRAVAKRLNKRGDAEFYFMDVTDTENVNSVISAVTKKYRKSIDVIINNAGIAKTMPIETLRDDQWDWVHETDLKGMMRVVRAAAPGMQQRKRGSIICISSIAGYKVGWTEHVPYCAAKSAIVGFVKGLAIELASYNIRVNGIAPGIITTAQTLDPKHSLGPKGLKDIASSIPLGRVGKPEEIANVATFLASDNASYVSGQIITVDGGFTSAL